MIIARSDADKPLNYIPANMGVTQKLDMASMATTGTNKELAEGEKTIHSGHFMVSCVQDDDEETEDSEPEILSGRPPEVPDQPNSFTAGFDFNNASHHTQSSYNFSPGSARGDFTAKSSKYAIDTSLSTLFECMTLAYSGKLTSPKWKNFKGIKLRLKDKIRLNNIIWREWHMQFIHGRRPIVCHFDPPISDKTHSKPEAVVLEGKYWKRRLESVTSEYKKWRLFFKQQHGVELKESLRETKSLELLLQQVAESYSQRAPWQLATTKFPASFLDPLSQNEDDDAMDFSDTLFTTLNQQNFAFPSPREMSGLGNADIMQPGLVQLQPNFDDFMDTIDMADMLTNSMSRTDTTGSSVFNMSSTPATTPSPAPPSSTGITPYTSMAASTNLPMEETVDLNSAISTSLFGDGNMLDVQSPASPVIAEPESQVITASVAVVPTTPTQPQSSQAAAAASAQNISYQASQIIRLILEQQQSQQESQGSISLGPPDVQPGTAQLLQEQPQQFQPAAAANQLQQSQLQQAQLQQPQNQLQTQLQQQTQLGQSARLVHQRQSELQAHLQQQQQQQQQIQSIQQHQQNQQLLQQQQQQNLLQQHLQQQQQQQQNQIQQQQIQLQQRRQQQQQLQTAQLQTAQLQTAQLQQIPIQHQALLAAKPQTVHLGTAAAVAAPVVAHAAPQVQPAQATVFSAQPGMVNTTPQTVTIIQNSSQLHSLLQSLNSPATAAQVVAAPPASSALQQNDPNQPKLAAVYNATTTTQQQHQIGGATTARQVVLGENSDSSKDNTRRASTGSVNSFSRSAIGVKSRKEGEFLVPQKPVTVRSKQRNLAPAPPSVNTIPSTTNNNTNNSPIVQQNTFLAQLLTGHYPTPASPAQVKREDQPKPAAPIAAAVPVPTAASYMPIQPAVTTVATATHTFSTVSLSEFKKNVFVAPSPQSPASVSDSILSGNSPSHNPNSAPGSPASPNNSFNAASPGSYSVPSPNSDSFSAGSPGRPLRGKSDGERTVYRENRRVSHITAEQKRRYNIKEGFDTLHQLVPALRSNPNAKISKAATLSKTAEFCRKLKDERAARQHQTELLRKEIEALNNDISFCQQQLPATGAPVTRQRADQMRDMFDDYVRTRTLQNWKFWIFSIIIRPLFDSYNNMVSTASVDDLCRTVLSWLEQHCSLVALRPGVLNSLCHLSTTTSILSDPERVAEQARQAVLKKSENNDSAEPSSSS